MPNDHILPHVSKTVSLTLVMGVVREKKQKQRQGKKDSIFGLKRTGLVSKEVSLGSA